MSRTFTLQISDSMGRTDRVPLRAGPGETEVVIGSDTAADVRVTAPGVSPRQCILRLTSTGALTIQNLSIESPTRVNGRSGAGQDPLKDGDRVEFAGVSIRIVANPVPTDAAPKVPIPGGPVPRDAIARSEGANASQRSETSKIAIPKSEIPRRTASPSVPAAPASASATPPPEPAPQRPIIPHESSPAPMQVAAPSPATPPSIASLRPATAPPVRPAPPPISPPATPSVSPDPANTTRARHATLRPATLRSTISPGSRAPQTPPPSPSAPSANDSHQPSSQRERPTSVINTDDRAIASVEQQAARSVAAIRAELPAQAAPYTDAHLRALAILGRSTAATLGFANEEHVLAYLKCMILVGDDLTSGDSKFPDIYFCLTLQGKPPEARIERALKIAQRVNSRGGVGLAPMPQIDLLVHSAPVAPHQPPSEGRVSEEILPAVDTSRAAPAPQASSPNVPAAPRPRENRERDMTQPMSPQAAASSPAPAPEPPQPDRLPEIEGFKILEKIGSGGMGTVYRAYHHRLEVEVAIKVFKSLHPEAKTLLSREARAAARLQHPNIVQVLDYQEFGKGAYYAMQLVKGEDAHELIVRVSGRMVHEAEADGVVRALGLTNDQLSPEARSILQGKQPWHRLVAWWMAGVADGLDRAHREGIVHRDIKPSNLLLARDGRMTITDFGLALRRDDPSTSGNTARAGTPRYLAPERIADWASGADLSGTDGRIDTWALGATLYELLTYRPAYDGAREAVMRDIVTVDPLPPSQVIWAVPAELDRICLTAMKRNPEERFQQAGEMASALRSWLMGDPAGAKGQNQPGVFKRFKK